jgi:hypothetical protein
MSEGLKKKLEDRATQVDFTYRGTTLRCPDPGLAGDIRDAADAIGKLPEIQNHAIKAMEGSHHLQFELAEAVERF